MQRYFRYIFIAFLIIISTLGYTSFEVSAYGPRPSRYSDLSEGHKELLAEVARERGYVGYKDAGGLNPEAKKAFDEMAAAAAAEGLNLKVVSGYRSYDSQIQTFFNSGTVTNPIQKVYGESMTDSQRAEVLRAYIARGEASAPPGYSEHHTGLAIDINSVQQSFENTPEFAWLQDNAGEYGFELSYPEGSTAGAGYEPWHWRYIGGVSLSEFETDPQEESSAAESSTTPNQKVTLKGANESQVSYDSFTNFPGLGRISNLCQLTQSLWYLGFIVLFLAVIGSILYGGFMYTSAGVNAAQVNQAKGVIQNAFIGLVLGLSVFIILQTIDPNFLTGNCEIASIDSFSYGGVNLGSDGSFVGGESVAGNPACEGCVSVKEAGGTVANWSGITGPGRTDKAMPQVVNAYLQVERQMKSKHNIDIMLTSAYSAASVGNHSPNSMHYQGLAVDMQSVSGQYRNRQTLNLIAEECRQAGFTFVLVESAHTHCDMR